MKAFAPNNSSKSAADAGKKKSAPSEKQKAVDNSPTVLAQQSYVASVFPQAIQRKEAAPSGAVAQLKLRELMTYKALVPLNHYDDPFASGLVPSKKRKVGGPNAPKGTLTKDKLYFVMSSGDDWTLLREATTDDTVVYWIETDKVSNEKTQWLQEPEVPKTTTLKWGEDKVRWREFNKPIMPGGNVDVTDIKQGGVGDCWLLACLAALASSDWLQKLKDSIVDNGNGTVTVKLFKGGESVIDGKKTPEPIQVIVDKWLPTYIDVQEELIYASTLSGAVAKETDPDPNQNPHIWPALIEKGVAALADNKFWKLDNKGPEKGFGTMMGGIGMKMIPNDKLDASAWADAITMISNGGAGTVTTWSEHAEMTGSDQAADISATVSQLIQGHVYYVVGADAGAQTITVENPHQTVHPPAFDLATAQKYLTKVVVVPKP